MKKAPNFSVRGSGGGYLLSHFRSTIGVVRLNFSVRNGKRWIPHAITTLMRLRPLPIVFTALCSSGGRVSSEMHRRTSREWLLAFYLITFTFFISFREAPTLSRGSGAEVGLSLRLFPLFFFFFRTCVLRKAFG